MDRLSLAIIILTMGNIVSGYEKAFEETPAGEIEIKVIPAGRLLESKAGGSYFDSSNNMFRPLFNYIQQHNIAMTTPVEARIEPGAMYFWVAAEQLDRATEETGQVKIIDIPARQVAAIGAKGSYNRSNFEKAKQELLAWVEKQSEYNIKGEPFGVYWNGPLTPWFLKKFEVQVEIEPAAHSSTKES
jgi:effector-binding domain-containing protein